VGDRENPDTWQLPHHGQSILKTFRGQRDIEATVDWALMNEASAALAPRGHGSRRVVASPEQILAAATHLAGHYRKAGKSLPDILAAIV
jgi:hypothetical protein